MDHTNRNFASFMQTNYDTVRVSYIAQGYPADHRSAPAPRAAMPAPVMPTPAWGAQDTSRPWITEEDEAPEAPRVNTYSYKVPKGLALKVGDILVVPVGSSIAFAKVEIIDEIPYLDFSANITYKWIIGKVEFDQYNEMVKAETEFGRKMEAVQRMRVQQEAINTMRAEFLSNTDPASAALFMEALKTIGAQVPAAPVEAQASK